MVTFGGSLRLGENRRVTNLMLATLYDQWFDGLDMTILADDQNEQAKMVENVLASFYLYAQE